MSGQILLDGVLTGALLALGTIGLTLTYAILRFANFALGQFVTAGAYVALVAAPAFGAVLAGDPIGGLTFGWPPGRGAHPGHGADWRFGGGAGLAAVRAAAASWGPTVMVIASFGASLALRSLIEFGFGPQPAYYSREIAMGAHLPGGVRATWDQISVLALAGLLMVAMHVLMTRNPSTQAMRAASENPALARLAGIDVDRVIRATWLLSGALVVTVTTARGPLAGQREAAGPMPANPIGATTGHLQDTP